MPDPIKLTEVEPIPEATPRPDASSRRSIFRRGNILRCVKVAQKYSAYGITAFAGLHLTSTILLPPFSVSAANSAFMAARTIYQSEIGEAIFVYGAFGVHIISGLILRSLRIASQYRDRGKIGLGRPSRVAYSGMILTLLSLGHWAALRYSPVVALGDSSLISLDYITFGLNRKFGEVTGALTLLASVFGYHALNGLSQYRRWKLGSVAKYATVAAGTTLALVSILTLSREIVPTGWLAEQYDLVETTTDRLLSWRD